MLVPRFAFTFRLAAILGLALFAALPKAESPAAPILFELLTSDQPERQMELLKQLQDANDPLVEQVLNGWPRGEIFIHETIDGTKIPFILDPTTQDADESTGIGLFTGEVIQDESGQPITFYAIDLVAVDTTAELRKGIRTVQDLRSLSSSNPNMRRDAAIKLGIQRDPEMLPHFRKRLELEKDAAVRRALNVAIALTQLAAGSPKEQVAAAERLGQLGSVVALDFLERAIPAEGQAASDPALVAAAQNSIRQIKNHLSFVDFIGTCFRGLSLSAVLLLAALGLAITFGLMGVINMAHGEFIMFGAYTAFITQNVFVHFFGNTGLQFDLYFVAALGTSFCAGAVLGLLLERGVIRFLYKRPLESLLATWGISLVLQQIVRTIFGAANVQVNSPSWLSGNVTVNDIVLTYNRIFVIGIALTAVGATWFILTRTSLGLQVRAVMQNRNMASCIGVRTERVNMITFAFGSGLAGMAGACLSQIGNVSPNLGQSHIIDCFMVVVLGGVGNLVGTVCASFGIGVTDQVLQPHLGAVLGKVTVLLVVILFLQWRPSGLFASRSRALDE